MPVRWTVLGSGSSGNCSYVETDEARVLIDAGFSGRQTRERLATIGRAPENLTGILITHEHSDHIQGLGGLAAKLGIPVYCNRPTHDEIRRLVDKPFEARIFSSGDTFELGDITVDTFPVPHDAQDPVGFLLRTEAGNIGFLTDLGHVTALVLERVRKAHALILEANHDIKLLQECPRRPWSLKQRILSRHGHLSNEAAAACAAQIMSSDLKHLYLGHLSRECNTPELAFAVVNKTLQEIGATHVRLDLTTQHAPSPTLTL
jgi:phosphoribosyl 1,2-cyclic phosphodiesterase